MAKFIVKQTLTFYWDVDAQDGKEAITIAEDKGEVNSTSSKYTKKTAHRKTPLEMMDFKEE